MKKEDIIPGDWYRILFGETPVIFLVEVLIRTLLIYIVLLVVVRLMGKRMGGQLTISELAVMITLGAIVSPGMQMPQTGLLLCILILVCALAFQRGMNLAEFKSKKFEEVTQGRLSILVKNGVMELKELEETNVSRQQLFSVLRTEGVYNLGEVDRVYLEACGLFTIFKSAKPHAGLVLYPPGDTAIVQPHPRQPGQNLVCANCGKVVENDQTPDACPACQADQWQLANLIYYKSSQSDS